MLIQLPLVPVPWGFVSAVYELSVTFKACPPKFD